ncbi:MAG: hypothetical protein EBR82_50660 [Caulobacteraceae bacterium]|nr:hypothetical protein [Caulobacteraceae bacterium]
MAKVGRLNKLEGKSKFGKAFINKIIDRIESIKPLAGSGIKITEKDDGIEISFNPSFTVVTASICVNGASQEVGLLTTRGIS